MSCSVISIYESDNMIGINYHSTTQVNYKYHCNTLKISTVEHNEEQTP